MVNVQGRRLTSEQRRAKSALVVEAYAAGASIPEAADRADCSVAAARNYLNEAGVPLRPEGRTQLPEGMITAKEAAALIGMSPMSLAACHHRGDGPPRAERPTGAHRHYTYYWRADVEQWLGERAERRLQRLRDRQARKRAERQRLADCAVPDLVMDWEALLEAVDARREAEGFTWRTVCRLTGTDEGHISRIRKGDAPVRGLDTFARLAFWATDSVPDEIQRFTRPA